MKQYCFNITYMTFPKVAKKDLILRIQSKIKQSSEAVLSQVLLSKVFDSVFESIIQYLEEGNEVTTPLGVIKLKTLPDTRRRDIGNNSFLIVKGYFRPKLALNDTIRKRFAKRGHTFLEPEKKEQ